MILSKKDLEHIAAACWAVSGGLSPEDRFDIRQETTIKLLERAEGSVKSVQAFAKETAKNLVHDLVRDAQKQQALLADAKRLGAAPAYSRGENWSPSWYAPHPDAEEFAPFAMPTARMMYVK